METLNLKQGTPEWHAHRATHFNASDAPAMMGASPYASRYALLKQIATGDFPEADPATQRLFDKGHRFEALARPIAEKIIGEELYPVVGTMGEYSASFDGLTMDEDVVFEHKTLNDAIRPCEFADDLPLHFRIQMEQQLMVSGASKCLFMASVWSDDDILIEEKHFWYVTDAKLRSHIGQGWSQFKADLANYQHVEVIPAAVAAPVRDLPVLFVQARGEVTDTNMPLFKSEVTAYLAGLNMKPSTDQEYADGKAVAANLRLGAKALQVKKSEMLAQTASIGEVAAECDLISKQMNASALALEKAVEAEEANRKGRLIQGGKDKFADHIAALNKRLVRVIMPSVPVDFAAAIKGKSKLESMENGIATELARATIAASDIADKIQINLATLDEHKDHEFLFHDEATLVMKAHDDLKNVIKLRISEHQAEEERKAEKIRQDERDKITKAAADKAEADAKAAQQNTPPPAPAQPVPEIVPVLAEQPVVQKVPDAPACIAYKPFIPSGKSSSLFFKIQSLVKMFDDESFTEAEIDRQIHYAERQVIERSRAA